MDRDRTIDYYDAKAKEFAMRATNFDEMRDSYALFVPFLPAPSKNITILDYGCGTGRDALYFKQLGYSVVATDASLELCKLAEKNIKQPVLNDRFEDLQGKEVYDAVWANASLLHVPTFELKSIFSKIYTALKPGGYFWSLYKYGTFEGERNERFFNDFTEEKMTAFLKDFPHFSILKIGQNRDPRARLSKENERWLHVILKKI